MEFRKWYEHNNEEFVEMPHLPKTICSWPKSSWLKFHTKYCIENDKYFVYPYISLSTNNGDAGTHVNQSSSLFQTTMLYGMKNVYTLDSYVKYDSFFENELIYDILGLTKGELCIDFYGEKNNRLNKRFFITRKVLPYKIVESYALLLKPYEMNIINHVEGQDLFLYDTLYKENNVLLLKKNRNCDFFFYIYGLKMDMYNSLKRNVKWLLSWMKY